MPAARGGSSKARNINSPIPAKRTSPRTAAPKDFIVISSSSDDETRAGSSKSKPARPAHRSPSRPLGAILDVIDISDDTDEDVPPATKAPVRRDSTNWKAKFEALEKELATLKKFNQTQTDELSTLQKQLADQEAERQLRDLNEKSAEASIAPSQLEDLVTCEICTALMWKPYILPNCGHTYCESCLRDWFNTTLAQHMQAHPGYDPNQQIPQDLLDLLRHPHYRQGAEAMIAAQYAQPEYSCPTCRERVRDHPTENFSLKSVVAIVAAAQGESSPQKPKPAAPSKGRGRKGKQPAKKIEGPWDGFFPAQKAS
ncbi:hypothetical protein HGRIS_002335 [Hohenbuehelia grisea]|uniref:RING-type domain-containing protein n=1 Tax=Hohenbuehelia grisea TaxID=104357 RepID=A0ABR3JL32_9AGAR